MISRTSDINIRATHPLISPSVLEEELPLSAAGAEFVGHSRRTIESILSGRGNRLLVIIGPSSIHDKRRGWNMHGACVSKPQGMSTHSVSYCACISKNPAPRWVGRV